MRQRFILTPKEVLQIIGHIRAPAVHVMDVRGEEFSLSLHHLKFREATADEVRRFWKLRLHFDVLRSQVDQPRIMRWLNTLVFLLSAIT